MSHDKFNAKVLSSFLFISPLPRHHRLLLEIFPHFPSPKHSSPSPFPPLYLFNNPSQPPDTHPETHPRARPAARFFPPPPCKTETSPYLCTRFRKRKRAATAGEEKNPRDSCGSRKNLLTSQLGFRPAKTGKTKTKPKHIDILEVTHTTSRRCGGDAARRARVQKRGPAAMTRQALKEKQKQSHTTKSLILAQDER